jgi:phosphate-selective porin OprO and OprP
MKRIQLLFALMLSLSVSVVMGQSRAVSGKVTSSKDDSPISNVEVRVKGAINAVQTDTDGTYIIQVPANSTDVLVFSHPDFDDVEIFLNNKTELDITMVDNIRYNQYGVRVNRNPLFTEERNGILVHESKTLDYRMWFDIRVQADGAMFFGEPLNAIGNGTSLRRARFATKVEFAKNWMAEFDLDIANSELELKDAYLQYTYKNRLELKVGNFKEGFSMESTTTSRYLTFMERPMAVNAFAPSRHVGFTAAYMKDWLLFIGGIHFQAVDDPEERLFSKDNNKDYGIDEGVSWTGRLVTMPFFDDPYKGLHFGVAGSYRTPKTDAEVPGTLRYDTRSLTSINRKKYMDTDLIGDVNYTTLTGLEAAGYYKNLRLQAEYLMSGVHRKDDLPTENFDGFYVFGSWLLFGGKYNYNTLEGEFTQVARGKSWGDVELALRYDYLSLNSGMDKIMGGAGEGITLGLNYYANNNVKIMLNYAYLNHDRYAGGKNKLFVGYDANGELTTNPQLVADAQGKAGNDYHMLSIRFEVDF